MKRHIPEYITETETVVNRASSGLTYSDNLKDLFARFRSAQAGLSRAKFYVDRAKNKEAAALVLPDLIAAFSIYKAVGDEIIAVKAEQNAWYASRRVVHIDSSEIGRMMSEDKAARQGSNWTGD